MPRAMAFLHARAIAIEGSCAALSLPATNSSLNASLRCDHCSSEAAACSTRATYSSPPLVVRANSFCDTRSRSVVKSVSILTQPFSASCAVQPKVTRATLRVGVGCNVARSLTTAQRFWRAALMSPSMLPLMSRQMARSMGFCSVEAATIGTAAMGGPTIAGDCASSVAHRNDENENRTRFIGRSPSG